MTLPQIKQAWRTFGTATTENLYSGEPLVMYELSRRINEPRTGILAAVERMLIEAPECELL